MPDLWAQLLYLPAGSHPHLPRRASKKLISTKRRRASARIVVLEPISPRLWTPALRRVGHSTRLVIRSPKAKRVRWESNKRGALSVQFQWDEFSPADCQGVLWDAVIIGAGMGGGTLGYALARKGLKVLFLERGGAQTVFPRSLADGRLRRLLRLDRKDDDLSAVGRWSRPLTIMRNGRGVDFLAPLGSGPGGSSAIYGAALERMRRIDFEARSVANENPPPMSDRWPIEFDRFRCYYQAAEKLFGVVGTRDPDDPDDDTTLVPPPPLSPRDQDFFDSFKAGGLKPYRLHVGIAYRPNCRECVGFPCRTDCKADGSSKALCPALRDHDAKILLNCDVDRLEGEQRPSNCGDCQNQTGNH